MDLNEIRIFTQVIRSGGFTAAARVMDMPKSTVSAKVSALEDRLGVSLLRRTTRKLHLTAEGEAYFERCRHAIRELEEAERDVTARQEEPQGLLRVTAPLDLAAAILPEVIRQFRAACPKVELHLEITDRVLDMVNDRIDVAIRAGEMEDSALTVRKLGVSSFIPVAAPAYIKEHGRPERPEDLADHQCIEFPPLEKPLLRNIKTGEARSVALRGPVVSNQLIMLRALARGGAGLAFLPAFLCAEDFASGSLVRVLPEWVSESDPIYLVFPPQRYRSPKVSAFVPYVIEAAAKLTG